ncbi:MAG: exodeoxyribonuclease V subunit beta [Proteobacteria bacterium]|nr:exodeoxyribonuclease V subunit beta [Pseudomonadota bacterium]
MQIFDLYSANLDGTKLIEASAGTGKTFTLSGLYIRYIVEKQLTPEQILVLTFTKAATAELKTRLREQLVQCRNHLQGLELVDKKHQQLYQLYESYKHQDTALKYVELALICFDQAAIFTINSFCQKVIEDFNSDCGSPVFQELMVKKDYVKKYVYEFWRKQQKNTPIEILATIPAIDKVIGKINGLLNKSHYRQIKPVIDWNHTQKIHQDTIELAKQWQEQKETLLDYVLSGDFHGGTYRVANRANYVKDMDVFFSSFNGNVIKFCADYIESKLGKNNTLKPMPKFFIAFDIFYNKVIYTYKTGSTGNNLAVRYLYECFNYVQQQLTVLREEEGRFDYSDQIKVVHEGIKNNPKLVKNIAKQWQCIMVDEFQDTDSMQLEIFEQCFNDGQHDLIYVGDPKQAIYDFRGADVFVYNQAKQQTKQQFKLSTNWRSSEKMLAATNSMFSIEHAFKFPWLTFTPSLAKPEQEFQLHDIYPAVAIINGGVEDRKSLLATEIKRFLRDAKVNNESIKPECCAILVNRNQDAIDLYEYLLSKDIAVNLWSESGVFTTAVAQQLYYLIRALNYPSKRNIFTTLHGMFFDTGLNQLQKLDDQEILTDFVNYRIEMNSSECVKVIEKIFADKQVYSRLLQRVDGERHYCDLQHLLELLQEQIEQGSNHSQLEQWIATQIQQAEFLENDEQRKRRIESDSKKIAIMTIHKSKGLEFDHVFIPYADKIKDSKSNENINLRACLASHDNDGNGVMYWQHSKEALLSLEFEKQAENMRNLYVAITRAKHRVTVGVDTAATKYESFPIARLINQIKDNPQQCAEIVPKQVEHEYTNSESIELLKPKTFKRNLQKPQSIYSFSALSKKQNTEQETFDDEVVELVELDFSNYFQFPKGAKSGTMQHEVLEHLDFTADLVEINQEVKRQLNRYSFDKNWQACLAQQIDKILNFNLWQNGPKLSQIKYSIDEMEFMLPISSKNKQNIASWLSEHRNTPTVFNQDNLQGYLTGFIDLVFEHNNKYYIVDYKSNYLGSGIKDYTKNNLKRTIEHHYYDLQYLLYSVALVKYLSTKIKGFDYQTHFGGIAYLFTRGVNGQAGQGVYSNIPDKNLIYSMIREFDVN